MRDAVSELRYQTAESLAGHEEFNLCDDHNVEKRLRDGGVRQQEMTSGEQIQMSPAGLGNGVAGEIVE